MDKDDKPSRFTSRRIAILGMGRLGKVLRDAFLGHGAALTTWNRTPQEPQAPAPTPLPKTALAQAELILLTVADAAIAPMVEGLLAVDLGQGQIVLHCAGRLDASVLDPLRRKGCGTGSLHPLQPLAGQTASTTPFAGIRIGVEGSDDARIAAEEIAIALGGRPFSLQGVDRNAYHAAAVFAANYTVTLAHIGRHLMAQAAVRTPALELLLPLMQANLDNLAQIGLPGALTGPISRCDTSTIAGHLQAMPQALQPLYKQLAQATVAIAKEQPHNQQTDWRSLEELLKE